MKTKFAIGCLVQWYECDMIGEYLDSLHDAISQYDGEVLVDFTIVKNEDLEKCISHAQKLDCMYKIRYALQDRGWLAHEEPDLVTIADYRRTFNSRYCDKADVLIWGESDAILPKQMFVILDNLHQMSLQNNHAKYLAFFGTCKMWDDSWLPLEHSELTNKPRNATEWWGTRYTMTKKEMNDINDKTDELEVGIVSPHKFNGCGLVISSEVIRSGVNIPNSVFFTHEDTSFMMMTNKVLGNIPQYIIKNILLVHNRNHPKKRMYVANENGNSLGERRLSNNWYKNASKMSEQNCYNLFNPEYKSYKWKDVWNIE